MNEDFVEGEHIDNSFNQVELQERASEIQKDEEEITDPLVSAYQAALELEQRDSQPPIEEVP